MKFAKKFEVDKKEARITGLFHDIARDLKEPKIRSYAIKFGYEPDYYEKRNILLLHGAASCYILEEENIGNDRIYSAILKHTIAEKNMNSIEKLLYIMDFAEPKRKYPESKIAYDILSKNIDRALFYVLKTTLGYLLDENSIIHPKSIKLYNSMILEGGYNGKINY